MYGKKKLCRIWCLISGEFNERYEQLLHKRYCVIEYQWFYHCACLCKATLIRGKPVGHFCSGEQCCLQASCYITCSTCIWYCISVLFKGHNLWHKMNSTGTPFSTINKFTDSKMIIMKLFKIQNVFINSVTFMNTKLFIDLYTYYCLRSHFYYVSI